LPTERRLNKIRFALTLQPQARSLLVVTKEESMAEKAIEVLLKERRSFPPSSQLKKSPNMRTAQI
jgi:hypothetical protein